jgi:hypothetical protein
VTRRTTAGRRVAHPAERSADRDGSTSPRRQTVGHEVGDDPLARLDQVFTLHAGARGQRSPNQVLAEATGAKREAAAAGGKDKSDRPAIKGRSATDVAACLQPVRQPHRSGVGEANDLAQPAHRACGKEVEHRHQGRRSPNIETLMLEPLLQRIVEANNDGCDQVGLASVGGDYWRPWLPAQRSHCMI